MKVLNTWNMDGNAESLDGSFETVADLLVGSYAQGLIIKVRQRQSQLNVQSCNYAFYWLQKWNPDS